MPFEIALTEVDVEAGPVANGDDDPPWLLGFRDPKFPLAVSVMFTGEQIRDLAEKLNRAVEGEDTREPAKPPIQIARQLPR